MVRKRRRISQKKRKEVFVRDLRRCAYCEELLPFREMEVDHKIPVADGGGDEFDNLQVTCRSCNEDKGDLTDDEYLDELKLRDERSRGAERRLAEYLDEAGDFDFAAWMDATRRQWRAERERRARRESDAESLESIMRRPLEI